MLLNIFDKFPIVFYIACTVVNLSLRRDVPSAYNPSPGAPSFDKQEQLFSQAFREAVRLSPDPLRLCTKNGPYGATLAAQLRHVAEDLSAINDSLEPDALCVSEAYRSEETNRQILALNDAERIQLANLRYSHSRFLSDYGENTLVPATKNQRIEPGLLDVPPFTGQGESLSDSARIKLCMNACYRMVLGGLLGWAPDEQVFTKAMYDAAGRYVGIDEIYPKLLLTKTIGSLSMKNVIIRDIIGADFDRIATVASRAKSVQPTSRIYCVVNTVDTSSVWHSLVLLSVDSRTVTAHEPRHGEPQANKSFSKYSFVERWAKALSRAQIVIATDRSMR